MDRALLKLVDDELTQPGWGVRFTPPLEQAYLANDMTGRVEYAIKSAAIALVVYNAFLIVDWLMLPDVFWLGVLVRLGISTPVGLLLLWIAYRYSSPLLGRVGPWAADWVVMITSWLVALTVAVILLQSNSSHAYLYNAGLVVTLLYGNIVQRVRFRLAVLNSVGVLALHLMVLAMFEGQDNPLRVPMLVMISFSVMATLGCNFALERLARRRFLLAAKEAQLLAELQEARDELIQLSQTDELTGLANRKALDEYLRQVWRTTQEEPQAVSLLLIEVDQLRAGEVAADRRSMDRCVREVAQLLASSVRPKDLVVRFDAQTFAAVLPDAESIEAMVAADRLFDLVRAKGVPQPTEGAQDRITVTIGVATTVPTDQVSSPDGLIARAQRALARATVAGRDQVSS